ncbi:MAG: hypothetical protein ACTSVA_05415 [Candidatus Njordarchaeales archaeon]
MESIFFMPGEYNDIVWDVGTWYIASGILLLLSSPFSPIPMIGRGGISTISILGTMLLGLVLELVAWLFEMVALIKTRKLERVSGEGFFSTGPLLTIIGIVLFMMVTVLTLLSYLSVSSTVSEGAGGVIYLAIGLIIFGFLGSGILALIGHILITIAFWRFGDLNKSDLIQIGSLVYLFIPIIGYLLIGFALRGMARKGREFLLNATAVDAIKTRLREEFPEGASIDLRDFARQYDIPPYLLLAMVNHWIITGELEGILMKYTYIVKKKQSP